MAKLIRFEKRPYWEEDQESDWWNIWEIPLYDPPHYEWDKNLPRIVTAVLGDSVDEIVDALNAAFNLGREFSRQR